MAVGTSLNAALREIGEKLTKYARDHNWKSEEYWIYYWIDTEWDRLHIIFVSKHFDPASELSNFVSVREFLEHELAGHIELLSTLGLVVRSSRQVEQGGIYSIDPTYKEFWTYYRS